MPDLILVIGPPASGKAAVGHALAEITGFRFFHNHLTADAAAALFGWGTPLYGEAAAAIRFALLSKALEHPGTPNIIFTFVWAFGTTDDDKFVADVVSLFEDRGRRVFFVELLASRQARIEREGTPLRLALKPSKRDVERARAYHAEIDARHRMNSEGDFPHRHHLVIDTERQPPAESALLVARHFGFGIQQP